MLRVSSGDKRVGSQLGNPDWQTFRFFAWAAPATVFIWSGVSCERSQGKPFRQLLTFKSTSAAPAETQMNQMKRQHRLMVVGSDGGHFAMSPKESRDAD